MRSQPDSGLRLSLTQHRPWPSKTTTGIDCSQIAAYHLLQQDNMRAGLTLMECGVIPRPASPLPTGKVTGDSPQPPNVLVSNRSCTSGSTCTKSESNVWHSAKAGDNTVVVNYNDHNGNNYSGPSYSTGRRRHLYRDLPAPLGTGHGTNYGDPIVVYNLKQQQWYAGDLVTGCGGLGIGVWTSPDGINWTTGACAHNGSTMIASRSGSTTMPSARCMAACTSRLTTST